jgi:peptidoglycan/LPS O-acetylase OafA/YrhL
MTGIRGVAAVWVMLFHAQQYICVPAHMQVITRIRILTNGWRAVDLFFILSGFVLMYAHGKEFHTIRRGPLVRFARLRFTRVYPLNAAVASLVGIVVLLQPGFVAWRQLSHPNDFSVQAFVRTMLLANRWFIPDKGEWNAPVWSLSLEVLGYLLFPLLAYCALRIARRWMLISIPSLLLLGAAAVMYAAHTPPSNVQQMAFVRMLSCFVTGMSVCKLWSVADSFAERWAAWIATGSVAALLIVCSLTFGGVLINFCFAALLYGLAFQKGVVNALLSSRVVVFLGEISFPLYLVHFVPVLWLQYFLRTTGSAYSHGQIWLAMGCWAIVCIALATLLHYLVEKPFHAWGRRWAGERVAQ